MLFRKRIKVPAELIEKYRTALISSIESVPHSERALYEIHLFALNELQAALDSKDNVEASAIQISRERRSYGSSYLSGVHGSSVESRFHELATLIENQIFRIKGKEWYYSL